MAVWRDDAVISRRDDDLLSAVVDDEMVGMSVQRGACYGFNGSATRIWDMLAEPLRFDELCARLMREYDVDAATCRRDVAAALDTLQSARLVDVDS